LARKRRELRAATLRLASRYALITSPNDGFNESTMEYDMKILMTMLLAAFSLTTMAHAGPADTGEQQVRAILEALKVADAEALRVLLTTEFRADLNDRAFRELVQSLQPRLQRGYDAHYLGTLTQDDFSVLFWKVSFADEGEDSLLRLVIFDGEVAGFLITRPFV